MTPRRLVISVCPREPGVVSLPIERGERPQRLNAEAVATQLEAIATRRGLTDRVRVVRACAGGCNAPGPNVTVVFYAMPRPGERPDHIATGWKTYVAALDTLSYLGAVIDQNLIDDARDDGVPGETFESARRRTRAARSRPR